ncbi:MAG: hypothetical protein LBS30_07155, partial [Planctomycetota bacterium]|nr:hypothetical protein [Planctomycetota bacterium]
SKSFRPVKQKPRCSRGVGTAGPAAGHSAGEAFAAARESSILTTEQAGRRQGGKAASRRNRK